MIEDSLDASKGKVPGALEINIHEDYLSEKHQSLAILMRDTVS